MLNSLSAASLEGHKDVYFNVVKRYYHSYYSCQVTWHYTIGVCLLLLSLLSLACRYVVLNLAKLVLLNKRK